MAKIDSDGFYYIVGRKKRFLKIFGSRINLDEVEMILASRAIEAVCTGRDDLMEIYVTDQGKTDEVINILINQLKISKSGFWVGHINEIPRNESGKIQYSALKLD